MKPIRPTTLRSSWRLVTSLAVFGILASAWTQASDSITRPFRFAEVTKTQEVSGLPPKLRVTFESMCNEEFVNVVRNEWVEPRTKKTSIAVGVIVRENLLSSCAGEKRLNTVDAGTTFSGREYEVVQIRAK